MLLWWLNALTRICLVKGTDQEGIYDKDPRKNADAVKLDRLSFDDLQNVLSEAEHKAGIHQIIDPEAVKVLKRKRVKLDCGERV